MFGVCLGVAFAFLQRLISASVLQPLDLRIGFGSEPLGLRASFAFLPLGFGFARDSISARRLWCALHQLDLAHASAASTYS